MPKFFSYRYLFVLALAALLPGQSLFAIGANPQAFDTHQPNGKKIRLHIRGDERFHWLEDLDGYTVVREKGWYSYANLDNNGRLKSSELSVGTDNPKAAGLKKRILPPPELIKQLSPTLISGDESSSPVAKVSPTGTVKNLVVLCLFSDHTEGVHTRDPNDYDVLFNKIGGDATVAPTGSVKDLYLENSYGAMTLESTVTVWVTLPEPESYYAGAKDENGLGTYPTNAQGMVVDALGLVDPMVDFSQFDDDGDGYIDAIDIIHSGYGAEAGGLNDYWIWSHRWGLNQYEWTSAEGVKVNSYHTEPALWGTSGTEIVRFAVIAHETGHFFGLPDLYDTDGSSEGIGSWGIMANSWGFDYSQLHPPHFSAWSKIELGWVTPTVISAPGVYTIDQVETNAQIYRIDYGYPAGEYLLIENRQPAGIETVIPQGGLCIYHIDELGDDETEGYPGQSGWPENGNHYRVAVLQADGNYDLEKNNNRGDSGDTYHGGSVSEISPATIPNTDAYQNGNIIITDNTIYNISPADASMTFSYSNDVILMPPQAFDIDITTHLGTDVTITLQATDDGFPDPPGILDYIITSLPNQGTLTDPGGSEIITVPYTLVGNGNEVVYTPNSGCTAAALFNFIADDGGTAPDGGLSNEAKVTISILNVVYTANMDSDPGWTFDGTMWEWGEPTGSGGSRGGPDPTSGYTNSNVAGYNLSGDYAMITTTEWATTPVIDCTGMTGVTLEFQRWLNVGAPLKDHAYLQISNNGSTWSTIWENSVEITDSSWNLQSYDISTFADNQASVYIRWGMGSTDRNKHYSGWNIDDVELFGWNPPSLVGDLKADCRVDSDDLAVMMYYWLDICGDCEGADMDADGEVNLADFSMFAQHWLEQL